MAVKDIIDVAGIPTTCGSRALQRLARPAERDAPCLAGARAADARIVGKTNLHELAVLPIGTNPWFGTPQNPLDPMLYWIVPILSQPKQAPGVFRSPAARPADLDVIDCLEIHAGHKSPASEELLLP